MLKEKYQKIKETIPEGVTLIAVTKTYEPEVINEAIDLGVTDIAESKVQEVCRKYDFIKPARWHLIGHLQTNKVRQVVDKVDMIQSVDSLHLAEEINKRCAMINKVMDVLIQVNDAGEEQKFGIEKDGVMPLADAIKGMPNLNLRGLMFIAPDKDPEDVRIYFKDVKKIFEELKKSYGEGIDTLSMGMSGDYKVAIEEGATCVRIGTALFGERDYTK